MEYRIDYPLTNRLIWSTGDISRFIMIAAVALITKGFICITKPLIVMLQICRLCTFHVQYLFIQACIMDGFLSQVKTDFLCVKRKLYSEQLP